jgi:hypothetical protein
MLLCELTVNSVVKYVSKDGYAGTHNWRRWIKGFDAPVLACASDHGGYARMEFGSITFSPELFLSDWPPPVNCAISIYYTDTTEAAKELVYAGTAHLSSFDREGITYDLFAPSYSTQSPTGAKNATLNSLLTTILTTIPEITSVDTTYARASSPNVTTTLSAALAIDQASNIAQFYSHCFYIVGATAYLVDMLLDNGSRSASEYEYFAFPTYQYKTPYRKASAGSVTRYSDYPYGEALTETQFHNTTANIQDALDNILDIENSPRACITIPMEAGKFPTIGEKITFPDTGNVVDLSSYIRVRKITYDFMAEEIMIEGEGAIAAA